MTNPKKHVLITGGAGFIGSHLADSLLAAGNAVVCVDDLSLGRPDNIRHNLKNSRFAFHKLDILNRKKYTAIFRKYRFKTVFHLAANSDIQSGGQNPGIDLQKTFLTTFETITCMKKFGVKELVFASSSAVYGDAPGRLAEDSGPRWPISFYGAAKLASEAYISAACENHGLKALILRFPNVIGERATHGAMYDFVRKLKKNPRELLILGDGNQLKPYLYVKDLVNGILFARNRSGPGLTCFNIGPADAVRIKRMAEIIVAAMGLKNVRFRFSGGDRGWTGDVPKFSYSLAKIRALGWKPARSSEQAVLTAIKEYLGKWE